MAADAELDAATIEQLAAEADRGKRFLDKLELPEAEEVFRGILKRLPMYRSIQSDRIIVASLAGLGEIHAKHCRSVRDSELDWLCGMLFALLFYRASGEMCAKIIRHRQPRGATGKDRNGSNGNGYDDYFSDVLSRCKSQSSALEVCLLAAMKDQVLERCTHFPLLAAPLWRKSGFDDIWLDCLWEFCVRSAADYQTEYNADDTTEPQLNDKANSSRGRRRYSLIARDGLSRLSSRPFDPVEDTAMQTACPDSPRSDSVQSSETVGRRRINFDRFQDAIKQFVSEVSTDIRNKYMHISGKIPHGLLEQRVCSELALRLSPGSVDGQELQGVFEALLAGDDALSMDVIEEEPVDEVTNQDEHLSSDGAEEEDEEEDVMETIDLYIKPSAMHCGKDKDDSEDVVPSSKDIVLFVNGPTTSSSALVSAKGRERSSVSDVDKTRRSPNLASASSEIFPSTKHNLSEEMNQTAKVLQLVDGKNVVLTKWRGCDSGKAAVLEYCLQPWSMVGGFEEVSQFTEKKERVPRSSTESEVGLHRYINESKLSQLLGHTAIKLADKFKKESKFLEACQLYKYSFGVFKGYPLVGGQQVMLAKLLVDIGSTCCGLGELESGTQLMREAAGLYESSGEIMRMADVWYQMGNAFLADSLRLESLLARVMQLTKEDLQDDEDEADISDGLSTCSSSTKSFSEEDDDTYCPCIHEAIACYLRAIEAMESLHDGGQDPGLLANVLSNLADCRLMTGNLDLAEGGYEEALRLFTSTFGTSLLRKNAHVLCMLGTMNFLARNYVRAATMYETSHILRQHLPDTDEPTLEIAWGLTMLGLSYHFLGHFHQSITWCIRSFKMYTRFFRGRLLTVDALSRWFIVQNLYVLGFDCVTLRLHKKALHYLNFCRNMMPESGEDDDPYQSIRVLLALSDACAGLGDETNYLKYYTEAGERVQRLEDETKSTTAFSRDVLYRLRGEEGPGLSRNIGLDGIIRQRAVLQQRDAETSIKDDMVAILLKLGLTPGSETDIDWAIGCYDDCVQGYRELQESREAARALSSLGTLCQVKGRLQRDDSNERGEFLRKAENYFREAFEMVDSSSPVWVQFGNFLYSEGRYAEALEVLVAFIFCPRPEDVELSYSGIEQMALPAHLHHNIQEDETLVVEARVLAQFLGLLCFRSLGMTRDADDALVEMYHTVVGTGSAKPLNYALLGYALLEARLFQEAAEAFAWSSSLQPESGLAYSNAWTCALLAAYAVMAQGLDYLLRFVFQAERNDRGLLNFQEKKSYLRRQASYRARKMIRKRSIEETMEHISNLRSGLCSGDSSATPTQGPLENHERYKRETAFKDVSTNDQYDLREHYPNCVPPNARGTDRNNRRVVIESSSWRPEGNTQISVNESPSWRREETGRQGRLQEEAPRSGSGTRKKWRSRLYHHLPEDPDNDLLMTDVRRSRVEQ